MPDPTPPQNPILFAPDQGDAPYERGPNLSVGGTDPDLKAKLGYTDEPKPEPKADEPPKRAAASEPPQAPPYTPRDFAQAIVMAEGEKERRAAEARAWQARAAEAARSFEPPPIPQGEDLEKLILDEKALGNYLQQNQNWTRQAVAKAVEMVATEFSRQMQDQEARLLTPMYEQQAESSIQQAAQELARRGVPNAMDVVREVDVRLRTGNPEAYWNVITNPEALVMGAQMTLLEQGRLPNQVAAPMTIGYNPGNPSPGAREIGSDPNVARVEQMFRMKFKPEDLENYQSQVDELRSQRGIR